MARLSAERKKTWLTPPAGPALTTHLIAGPALVLQGGDEQVGGVRAAPLAPGLRPQLTFGSLLTEDQHRSDALAPVPQPQGRQVPTDHLDLTVQLHLAEPQYQDPQHRDPQLGFEISLFPPGSAAAGVLDLAGCPRIRLSAFCANILDFLNTVAL